MYRVLQFAARVWISQTLVVRRSARRVPDRPGGYVLAVTHLSHLEPVIVGTLLDRKIDWMTRIEFFRNPLASATLYALDAFPVNRFGVPVSAVRTAIERLRAGRVVGIFPEGGVATGPESVCNGGPIREGACLVAQRAGVPILPCVVFGTPQLSRVDPWLPMYNGRAWVGFGDWVYPVPAGSRRAADRKAARREMARRLCAQFRAASDELRRRFPRCEEWVAAVI